MFPDVRRYFFSISEFELVGMKLEEDDDEIYGGINKGNAEIERSLAWFLVPFRVVSDGDEKK